MRITRRDAFTGSAAAAAVAGFTAAAQAERPSGPQDLAAMDAVATAAAIRSGHVSAVEVVDAAIERAARLDASLNAIVTQTFDAARAGAAAAAGPWAGVPFFVKDLTHVKGVATEYGSRAFKGFVAPAQSDLVDRMFALGLVSLGKSATPEFGLTATTEPYSSGAARNPWNIGHSTGGSSGGAAALVAAGVVPVAHSSDGGGSIRIPVACCGVVGLKPSRGRMPLADATRPRPVDISVHGAVTRSVRDTAAFLAAVEAPRGLAPTGLVEGPSAARRKIALFVDAPAGGPVDAQSIAAARKIGALLSDLGHQVEEIASPFDTGVLLDFGALWAAGTAEAVAGWEAAAKRAAGYDVFEPFTLALVNEFEKIKHTFPAVIARLQAFEAAYAAKFQDFDLLMSPTLGAPAPEIGWLSTGIRFETASERLSDYACFTPFMNVSGAPAISLPLALSKKKLPIGIQFAAAMGQERMLLELAYELEEAAPWNRRTPPVFG